jgi:hypothetical protein
LEQGVLLSEVRSSEDRFVSVVQKCDLYGIPKNNYAHPVFEREYADSDTAKAGHEEIVQGLISGLPWNPAIHTDEDNNKWCWLRAVEWGRWPIFLSQSIVPVLLLFLRWQTVLLGLLIVNCIWGLFVRYRFISISAAYWGVFVAKLKWISCPGAAIILFLRGNKVSAYLALLWPLLILTIGVFPRPQIGRIQSAFASAIGGPLYGRLKPKG